jgi:hypothetical protein
MSVGIPRWDVKRVEHLGLIQQRCVVSYVEFLKQARNDVTPSLLTQVKVESFQRFLRRLVSRETRPLVSPIPL